MDKFDNKSEPITNVRANRIDTGENPKPTVEENVAVIKEVPVLIDVEGIESYTLLCTPLDRKAMAIGFLYSEGVIDSLSDIKIIKECDDDPNTIRVRLNTKVPRIADSGRNLMIVSSCGACGTENLKKRLESLPSAGNSFKIEAAKLRVVYESLHKRQPLFDDTGATHAAIVFDSDGQILTCAEDTGRHNALDKAIGKCLIGNIPTQGRGVALTSRLSLEMVSRCARAGIELITAVSAPTSMALDLGQSCNITLCAFVRQSRATIFTHPSRIIGLDK